MRDRPIHPSEVEGWDKLPSSERSQLNQAHRSAVSVWYAEKAGRLIVGRNGTGFRPEFEGEDEALWPTQFCAECSAGGSPNGLPFRGTDSYGDCAEDGEPVYWTVSL
jgi:hypothetical protein